jgi:hypothetical protein
MITLTGSTLYHLFSISLPSDVERLCGKTSVKDLRDAMQNPLIQVDEVPFDANPEDLT